MESAENADDSTSPKPCTVCSKPNSCKSHQPTKHHCRDCCTHGSKQQQYTADIAYHNSASSFKPELQAKSAPFMSALMPPEIQEIAEQATKDAHARMMGKKNQEKLENQRKTMVL